MTSLNQETQTNCGLKKMSHIRRMQQALFQVWRSFTPNPPWSFVFTIVVQATFAVLWASTFPLHRKVLHMELIFWIHALGRINDEHQKVVIPKITVFIAAISPRRREFSWTRKRTEFWSGATMAHSWIKRVSSSSKAHLDIERVSYQKPFPSIPEFCQFHLEISLKQKSLFSACL